GDNHVRPRSGIEGHFAAARSATRTQRDEHNRSHQNASSRCSVSGSPQMLFSPESTVRSSASVPCGVVSARVSAKSPAGATWVPALYRHVLPRIVIVSLADHVGTASGT